MEDRPQDARGDNDRKDGATGPQFDAEAARGARPAVPLAAPAHAWKRRARVRVMLIALASFAAVGALVWYLSVKYWATPVTPIDMPPPGMIEATPAASATPTAAPDANVPSPAATATPDASPQATTPTPAPTADGAPPPSQGQPGAPPGGAPPGNVSNTPGRLLVPVAGIRPEQLSDTFTESRSAGRAHNAIDIIAPKGTPVVAVADGRVIKLFQSVPGGITVYQLDPDNRTVYYYAHLERYADGLAEGQVARRGETIGYVGDTGNAGPGNYHLHFSVSLVADPKRWWEGESVNPYPLLTGKN